MISVKRPSFHAMSTLASTADTYTFQTPLDHWRGSAGNTVISSGVLCTSISAIAAGPPRLPSI